MVFSYFFLNFDLVVLGVKCIEYFRMETVLVIIVENFYVFRRRKLGFREEGDILIF